MGAGNFTLANAETVYIDDMHVLGETEEEQMDQDLINLNYEDMVDNILALLPDSFSPVKNEWYEGGCIIAENNFYTVVITGWVSYYALSVVLKDNDDRYDWGINPLAAHHHSGIATRFFDKVHDIYPLRVPTSAWTSGAYVKQAA
jgi:hypothetical protein